ncbi:Cysteine-rich protein [Phytophthora palmivora]|uniref:Cysteine-rich protein n=1 Tax=Phytophthora palmivora TaxID=4796 RepID=A0A2P4YMC8_9STRA|nr:Cysteine-rich protein [Phytophthora palmivora]
MQSAAYIAAIAAMLAAVKAESGSGQPGYCKDDKSCEENYVCISVQTTRSGIEDVKQCLPYKAEGDVCSGTFPGLCPSFSTWDTAFQSISSVCAYQLPSGTDQCLNGSFSGSDTAGYVSCMDITEGSGSEAESVGVIYGCVDFDGSNLLFEEDSDNWDLSEQMNYTAVINEGCVNPNNNEDSDVVCSGRGTCAPYSSGSMDYYCECNVGYNGTYCQKVVSNKCTLESQCQAGTCNLTTQECECDEGTTGDQCAYCDPSSSKACNGHGECIAATSESSGSSTSTTSGSTTGSVTGTVGTAGSDSSAASSASSTASSSSTAASSSAAASDSSAARFLKEAVGMASASGSGSGNVCKCESGYAGDQCTRKVDSSSSGTGKKKSKSDSSSSDASSVATSIALVASAFVVALLN